MLTSALSALSTPVTAAPPRPARPMPAPGAALAAPRDGVDLSAIDTAEKAALLPTLNPPMLSILYGALNPGATLEAADFALRLGNADGQVHYQSDPADGAMVANGTLAGQTFTERWTLAADGGVDINGQIGANVEALHARTDNQYYYLDGKVGSVEVHEKGFLVAGPTDGQQRYVLDGTVGNETSHSEIYRYASGLGCYGYLGGQATESSFNATPSADGTSVAVSGSGMMAGTEFTVAGNLSVQPPPAPPAPAPAPAPADPPAPPDLDIPTPDWDPVIWPPT